jgi:cell division protein FtsQ
MQTNPGGGMSYDARYGGDIKPTSATASAHIAAQTEASRRDKEKRERDRLDPEAEAEIRENRRLYREYVDNERRTMDRAERDRRRMEEYYAARSGRLARKLRELFILTAAFAVTLCLISVIVYKFLFVVTEVTVYGDTSIDADSVIAASGVERGDNLYSFSASSASSAVTLRYPIIKSVAVKRTIPNKVAFTVTEDEPVFYCDIFGEQRMLSADLRVMGVKDDSYEGLIRLKLPSLEYAVDGREVQYADGKQNRYVAEIISAVMSSSLADRMTMMDLTHSYDITMVCDGKYLLSFGEYEEMDIKIKIAAAVLEDELFSGGNKATVDLSDTSQTSVIIDNQLDLD